jgi:hypothetical protein
MTLFVVLGLVAVVVGVLVAVALGMRSMRAGEREEPEDWDSEDWDSPEADSDMAGLDDLEETTRRRGVRRRSGNQRASAGASSDDYDGRRGLSKQGGSSRSVGRGGRAHDDDLDYDTGDFSTSDNGTSPGYGPGYRRTATPAQGYDQEILLGTAAGARAAGARAAGARAAGRPARAALPAGTGGSQATRRRAAEEDRTQRRSRQVRGRGGDGDGWNDTNWEQVSDEDYWAELSSDKPLASRTAQSAADLRSPEPEPEKQPDTRTTSPNRVRPEPQTATMAMPEYGGPHRVGAGQAQPDLPVGLPVRRTGNATDPGGFPSVAAAVGHLATDYTDPDLAALASLGGAAVEGHVPLTAPTGVAPSPVDPQTNPPGSWPSGGYGGQGDWSYRGQDPAGAGSVHSASAHAYQGQSYGLDEPGTYAASTPGYGLPANPGYAASNSQDTRPNGPNGPNSVPMPAYGAQGAMPDQTTPDQTAGQFGSQAGRAGSYGSRHGTGPYPAGSYGTGSEARGSYGTGSEARGSYGTGPSPAGSYGTGSYGTGSEARGSYGTGPSPAGSYGTGSYGAGSEARGSYGTGPSPAGSYGVGSYGAGSEARGSYGTGSYATDSYPAGSYGAGSEPNGSYGTGTYGDSQSASSYGSVPNSVPTDHAWTSPSAFPGRTSEGGWQDDSANHGGGHAGTSPDSVAGYGAPAANGYAGGYSASPPGTPAGGMPVPTAGNPASGYASPAPSAGFPSGYLSSSALSARHGMAEPEQLTGPGSDNPYGSYVTGPASPPADNSPGTGAHASQRGDAAGYGDYRPYGYGGYGDYSGGTRR